MLIFFYILFGAMGAALLFCIGWTIKSHFFPSSTGKKLTTNDRINGLRTEICNLRESIDHVASVILTQRTDIKNCRTQIDLLLEERAILKNKLNEPSYSGADKRFENLEVE